MGAAQVERALGVRRKLGPFFARSRAPVIVVERDGAFVSANDAALAQYGYGLDELVAMRIHDFMAVPRPQLPEDLERAYRGDCSSLDRRAHRRKDGSVVWVLPVAGPVTVEEETFIVSVLEDVTPLVSAEERAQFERERGDLFWEATAERIGASVVLLDRERRIVRANRTVSLWRGRPEENLVGQRCEEVFLAMCSRQPCPHALALDEQRRFSRDVRTHYGRPLHVEVWPSPPNDLGVALVHFARDASEEKALESRLVAADRLASVGRIAAGVAHEVNNPAAFVTLALPMVRERIVQGRPSEALALLDEAGAAMRQITEVMREVSGVARDRPRAVVELGPLVAGAIRIASYEVETRAKVVHLLEEGVAAEVRGARIAQVLLNLVLNAAQALPSGDPDRHRIEVCVRRSGDRALIEVADTGPGVPDALGDRIFEPFFTTRASAGGTGLGLWLSRNIVEEEGGTLTWHNRPGGGAVFVVSLPLWRGEARIDSTHAE